MTRVYYDALTPDTMPTAQSRRVDYAYDLTGNRTKVTDNNVATSYAANVLNQYTLVGSQHPAYDGAGNLIALGTSQFSYDAQNRMVSATVGTNMVQSWYDARNRCVARRNYVWNPQTSSFSLRSSACLFYDGWDLIEELDTIGNATAYVHGPRTDELIAKITATNTVYYHADILGNVTHLTDESGNVVEQYRYDIFGKPTIYGADGAVLPASRFANRFLFTGREWLAELGLYDYRNRVYSPQLGRFLQPDPLGFGGKDVNIYRYCQNKVTMFKDPLGLCSAASGKKLPQTDTDTDDSSKKLLQPILEPTDPQKVETTPPPPSVTLTNLPPADGGYLKTDPLSPPPYVPDTGSYTNPANLNLTFNPPSREVPVEMPQMPEPPPAPPPTIYPLSEPSTRALLGLGLDLISGGMGEVFKGLSHALSLCESIQGILFE